MKYILNQKKLKLDNNEIKWRLKLNFSAFIAVADYKNCCELVRELNYFEI